MTWDARPSVLPRCDQPPPSPLTVTTPHHHSPSPLPMITHHDHSAQSTSPRRSGRSASPRCGHCMRMGLSPPTHGRCGKCGARRIASCCALPGQPRRARTARSSTARGDMSASMVDSTHTTRRHSATSCDLARSPTREIRSATRERRSPMSRRSATSCASSGPHGRSTGTPGVRGDPQRHPVARA